MITIAHKFFNGIRGLIIGLSVTLRNNFRKPVTIQYGYAPRWGKKETRPIAPRYRGRFVLVREPATGALRCTGCGLCARACPGRCIEVSGESRKVTAYRIDADKCLMCGLCVEACPFEALGMMQETLPFQRYRINYQLHLNELAQQAGDPMPGVMPSTVGHELRPGKQPYGQKKQAAAE